jgi:hypothetical protein
MTTADWALIISLVSATVALSSFVWNVWSKFIYPKPKVQVSIAKMFLIGEGWEDGPETISISVTNHGPSEVTIRCAVARPAKKWYQRKYKKIGMLNPYKGYPYDLSSHGPFSGGLPKKLAVGEEFSLYFPVERDWFEKEKLVDFGVNDTFNRLHWAPRRQVRKTRKDVLE